MANDPPRAASARFTRVMANATMAHGRWVQAAVTSAAGTSFVQVREGSFQSIERLVAPFFTLAPGARGAGDAWLVGGPELDDGSLTRHAVNPLGEPTSVLGVHPERRVVSCITPDTDAWVAQNVVRYTRALHRLMALREGALFVHSALLRVGSTGIALVGGSRSGKTSTALSLAAECGAVFVVNDDLSIHPSHDGGWRGSGWPRAVSIRLDSVERVYPGLSASSLLRGLEHPANASILRLRDEGVEEHGTALLYPWELASRLGVRVAPESSIDVLVFPSFTDHAGASTLRRLGPEEAAARLNAAVRGIPVQYSDFLVEALGIVPVDRSEAVEQLCRELPAYEFKQSFGSLRTNARSLASAVGTHPPRHQPSPITVRG